MENFINDRIPLSGRFLVRLAKNDFQAFKLLRKTPQREEMLRFAIDEIRWSAINLMVYESGKWVVNGSRSSDFEYVFNRFINNYLASLIQKVPDIGIRFKILSLFNSSTFTNLPSLILAVEVLTSAAIKYPDKYPYLYDLLSNKRLHRLRNNNAPYILLSILYGNNELAESVTSSLTGEFSQYYFSRSDNDRTLDYLIRTYSSEKEGPQIKEQILSLKIPPYESEDIPF